MHSPHEGQMRNERSSKTSAFGGIREQLPISLGLDSPFFPGILLSKKPPKTLGKQLVVERTMVEQNGDQPLEFHMFLEPHNFNLKMGGYPKLAF